MTIYYGTNKIKCKSIKRVDSLVHMVRWSVIYVYKCILIRIPGVHGVHGTVHFIIIVRGTGNECRYCTELVLLCTSVLVRYNINLSGCWIKPSQSAVLTVTMPPRIEDGARRFKGYRESRSQSYAEEFEPGIRGSTSARFHGWQR